jgi:hypothetical protein
MWVYMSRNVLLHEIRVWGVPARCHCVLSTAVTLGLTELTIYLEYSPSLEASSCSVNKFPIFHPTGMFITTCTTARDLSLSWAWTIQSTTHHYIFWSILISSHRRLGLPSGLFPPCFPHQYPVRTSSRPICTTCPACFIHLDFIIRNIRYWKSILFQTRKWCIQSESESSS